VFLCNLHLQLRSVSAAEVDSRGRLVHQATFDLILPTEQLLAGVMHGGTAANVSDIKSETILTHSSYSVALVNFYVS